MVSGEEGQGIGCCEGAKNLDWATKGTGIGACRTGVASSNQRMTESKSVALPLGYTPMVGGRIRTAEPEGAVYSPS